MANVLADTDEALPLATLLVRLRRVLPLVPAEVIMAEITSAAGAGLLHIVDGAVTLPPERSDIELEDEPGPNDLGVNVDRCLRAVVVDVESVVRLDPDAPEYRDARIWQIGAVKLSVDDGFTGAGDRFSIYVALPSEEWLGQLRSDRVRALVERKGVSSEEALERFRDFCADADVLVAYNGISVDFPLLDAASDRARLPHPSGVRVDAFYLALACWPFSASGHRLARIAAEAGVDSSDLKWHDAADDAELTARLLRAAADVHAALPDDLRAVLDAVTNRSIAWRLLRELAANDTCSAPAAPDDATVAAALSAGLSHLPVRRAPAGGVLPGTAALRVPGGLKRDGRVSPHQLARVVAGPDVGPRRAQEEMAELLSRWLPDSDGAIEAPTGTGKSLALIAVALDHLEADPTHRVVVATHTRQLQAQLARDVDRLGRAVPGLLELADVVKGATNRLSMRALVTALADTARAAIRSDDDRRRRRPSRSSYADDPGFAELLAAVVLRLLGADTRLQQWAARSVDAAELPAFFGEYMAGRYGAFLAAISQAHGEYELATGLPELTDTVEDALGGHRFVLANHALLLSHLDDFDATGADTLLLVDEAHTLEGAATDALTSTVALGEVEGCLQSAATWLASHPGRDPVRARVRESVDALRMHCEAEQLPQAISKLLDVRASTGLSSGMVGRTATLASPFGADHGEDRARASAHLMQQTAIAIGDLGAALWAFLSSEHGHHLDWFARERTQMLAVRLKVLEEAARRIVAHATSLLGPVTPGNATNRLVTAANPVAPTATPDSLDDPALDAEDLEAGDVSADDPEDTDVTVLSGVDDEDVDTGPAQPVASQLTQLGNQIVYVIEDAVETPAMSRRDYAASVNSSPIELQLDHDWLRFRRVFARIFLTSATLTVAGDWDYLKRRLGLPDLRTAVLDTPFDLARQVRLVAFSDFPSWSEHSKAAIATTVHQLVGYAREITSPDPAGATDPTTGQVAVAGGALVLTTARKSAAAIAQQLAEGLVADAAETGRDPVAVHAAGLLGNRRATEYLSSRGGIAVGTKGLWAGVDIQPAQRLKLVWINKLPFASAGDPVVTARRAAIAAAAAETGADDPDRIATETYYLPLAAVDLRQAVGRLVRSDDHTGVVVISDRKLAGDTRQRRTYRRIFLESLEPGLHRADATTGEACGANVVPMADGWRTIWQFLASQGALDPARAAELCTDDALDEHTVLPHTRRIRQLALTQEQHSRLATETRRWTPSPRWSWRAAPRSAGC